MVDSPPEVAVIGANGFLGRNLTKRLHDAETPVLAVDRGWETDNSLVEGVLGAQTIYWAASTINPAIAASDPLLGALEISRFAEFLELLDNAGSVARIVNFSSGGTVYGAGPAPFSEKSLAVPNSEYGRVKLAIEGLLADAGRGLSVRLSNPYGPGQYPAPGQGVISHWLSALAHGKPLTVIGDPASTIRDYVYISDVVDALVQIHQFSGELPNRMNIGSGRPTSLADLLNTIRQVVPGEMISLNQLPARPFDLAESWLDTSLVSSVLNWQPQVSLLDGIGQTWQWIKAVD